MKKARKEGGKLARVAGLDAVVREGPLRRVVLERMLRR